MISKQHTIETARLDFGFDLRVLPSYDILYDMCVNVIIFFLSLEEKETKQMICTYICRFWCNRNKQCKVDSGNTDTIRYKTIQYISIVLVLAF